MIHVAVEMSLYVKSKYQNHVKKNNQNKRKVNTQMNLSYPFVGSKVSGIVSADEIY